MAEKTVSYEAVLGAVKRLHDPAFDNSIPSIPDDEYSQRLKMALHSICRPDYPIGMIPWLGEHRPDVHAELTEKLPEEMSRLWIAHRPLDEFDQVLRLWSEAHRKACNLYRASGAAKQAMLRYGGSDR